MSTDPSPLSADPSPLDIAHNTAERKGAMVNRKYSGFTMIEMLVVIAVIVLLAGMLFLGGKTVIGKSKVSSTRVTLNNLAGMLAELDAKTRGATQFSGAVFPAPGDVSIPGTDRDNAIVNAQAAMLILRAMPTNKQSLEKISTDLILKEDTNTAISEAAVPVVIDAWGNPIIIVPSDGLSGVSFEDHAAEGPIHTITSVGVLESGTAAATARPFFASAGEDGSFEKGDDNIYSFEN